MSPQAVNREPFDRSVTCLLSLFRKLQGGSVSTYISLSVSMLWNTCLCWLKITWIVHSSLCSGVSLSAAACSFTANSLIVSLENLVKNLDTAFYIPHAQDGKMFGY